MDEEMSEADIVCGNPDCRIGESGKCVEGLDLGSCPHYGRPRLADAVPAGSIEGREVTSLSLASALKMPPSEASRILRQIPSRVIAIVGASDSGKSSLIAGLYDLFQMGPIEDIRFSRCSTLHAFEHACHDARDASRRMAPHMNRTPIQGEANYYHLEVSGGAAGPRLALAIADRAGEEYREVEDDISAATRFFEVTRSDTLTILVDGERLLEDERHNIRSSIIMKLQGFRDGSALPQEARLALVLTKLDAIRSSPIADQALGDFDAIHNDVRRLFGDKFAEIEAFQVAASPRVDGVPRGTGLGQLLLFWIGKSQDSRSPKERVPSTGRMFAHLRLVEEPNE